MGNMLYKPIIAQYFGIWSGGGWELKFRNDTPFNKLNRLYVAFGKIVQINGHFSIDFDGSLDHIQDIRNRMQQVNPNAEIILVVGGDGSAPSYGGAASDSEFATNVRDFLIQNGFNGLDVDWETNLDRANLSLLLTNLSLVFKPANLKLTLDVWPWMTGAYDIGVFNKTLDQINIMTYGTGLDLDDSVMQFRNAGLSYSKMIGGIITERDFNQFGGTVDTLGTTGTINQKSTYAKRKKLAGMMAWRLDNDYSSIDNPDYPTYQGALALWNYMNS